MLQLVCPQCRVLLAKGTSCVACPACQTEYPVRKGLPRFTTTVDVGFDKRWQKHPKPQITTAGIFEMKTGWKAPDLAKQIVLDAGCGCGRFSEIAFSWGASVVGVDGSEHGIEAAARLLPKGQFIQADLLHLPLASASVDKAFSIGVLHHTADPKAAFQEIARTVKPGGELGVWLYINPGGDQNQKVVDPEVALAAEFLHMLTKTCPPEALHTACEQFAPRLRDIYAGKWGPLQQVLRASNSLDDEECISDTFDWHTPQYRSGHTINEIRGWFIETGFEVLWFGDFPVSLRGIKKG